MAQPVWVLSVDLQTKTATFQSGMADAAKSARGAFKDIKTGAGEMGRETGVSMMEARHGVMLLGEEFGVHMPRALTSFIASIGPIGAAMEAAFPFLAIAVGATLILEHLAKLREEGEKLAEDQVKLGTAAANALNSLDEKLLTAGIRADELRSDHLGALKLQLELIDKQSMAELVHEFDQVAKAADVVFKELEGHWYTAGVGSAGAQHALTKFRTEYENLLARGKDKEAADLLRGTRESAEHILTLQREYDANQKKTAPGGTTQSGDYGKFEAAANELRKAGVGITEKEVQSQQALVDALQAQAEIQERVGALKKLQDANATHATNDKMDEDNWQRITAQYEAERQGAELEKKMFEERHRAAVQELQQSEKEKIEVTDKASAERLAAISAAIKEEEKYGLQETSFYLSLLNDRLTTAKAMQDEADKQKAEAGREAADNTARLAELSLAADREQQSLTDSAHRMTEQKRMNEALKFANAEYAIQMTAFSQEIAALDKHGKDYDNKLKALQDKQKQRTQQHENDITRIKDEAAKARNARIIAAEARAEDIVAQSLASTILRHQTAGQMLLSLGDQLAAGMLQNAIKSMLAMDMTKEKDAAHAARKAFNAGMEFPFPANIIAAPVMGAAAFAAVMAFEKGGIVPGVGRGDVVPAMLTPGEGVIPKKLMDRINAGPEGGSGHTTHLHYRPTFHLQAIDKSGVQEMLHTHADEFSKHLNSQLRKMNKG